VVGAAPAVGPTLFPAVAVVGALGVPWLGIFLPSQFPPLLLTLLLVLAALAGLPEQLELPEIQRMSNSKILLAMYLAQRMALLVKVMPILPAEL